MEKLILNCHSTHVKHSYLCQIHMVDKYDVYTHKKSYNLQFKRINLVKEEYLLTS